VKRSVGEFGCRVKLRLPSSKLDSRRAQQWGKTTATSFTVQNLNPGSRYTVNVLARDGSGSVSWAHRR
jgi:hypothetical protein